MELRPFRAIRFSPEVIERRGLDALIAPLAPGAPQPGSGAPAAAPENIRGIVAPETSPAASADTLKQWLAQGVLWKERRPGMWLLRLTRDAAGTPRMLRFLVALVRVDPPGDVVLAPEGLDEGARDRRLAALRDVKADFAPALIVTRAPLTAALATTRRPDLSVLDAEGVRHDLLRITDYAEHVELQGLVKNAEASLADGRDGWESARELARDPAAAKLPGARYKLCAIVEETELSQLSAPPRLYAGFWGFSLEDPVY